MSNQAESCYKIISESSKSRPMDISPQSLSEELLCSINTIKSRIKQTGLNYEINESNHYQLFNYECLPILKAYLKSDRWKECTREDMSAFLRRLMLVLEENPDQSFCRYYLYNDSLFQRYMLQADLHIPIAQRLDTIRKLAEHLTVEPVAKASDPFYPQISLNILGNLDKIVFELSNFVESDTKKPESCADKKGDSTEYNVTELVRYWCNDLMQKRISIESEKGKIDFSIPEASPISDKKEALNNRLLNETLDERKRDYARKFESLHVQIGSYKAAAEELNTCSPDIVKGYIEVLMQHNIDAYLCAIFEGRIAPEFDCIEDTKLNSMMVSLIESWYYRSLKFTSGMERIITTVMMLLSLEKKQSIVIADMDSLRKNIELSLKPIFCIRDYWEVMVESKYIPSDKDLACAFSYAIDQADLSNQRFGTQAHKQVLEQCFTFLLKKGSEEVDTTPLRLNTILALCAVTLETFLRKHAEAYADYYTKIFAQYQSIYNKINMES